MSIDVDKIKVFGAYLDKTKPPPVTGKKVPILIRSEDEQVSRSQLKQAIHCVVDGPTKPEVLWSTVADKSPEIDERTVVGYFVPVQPGKYKLTVRCNGKKLPSAPFEYEVTGPSLDVKKLLEKVTVHGRGFELGKAFTHNQFVVDCSQVQPPLGSLKVHVKGPERASANLDIIDNGNGTFTIRYKPTSPGMYTLQVKIADTHIPGSPFSVRVTEHLSS